MSGATERSTTSGDPGSFQDYFIQALDVLKHESPTPREEFRFYLLGGLVTGAIGLSILYVALLEVVEVDPKSALSMFVWVGAAILYAASIPVCASNIRLVRKLHRLSSLRRQWTPSWTRGPLERLRDWLRLAGLAVLAWFGVACLLFAGVGLHAQLSNFNLDETILIGVFVFLGISCILMCYVEQARWRLRLVGALRDALIARQPAALDALTRLQRKLINDDRKQSLRDDARNTAERGYAYRESQMVRDAKPILPATDLVAVLAHVARIIVEPPRAEGFMCYDRVAGTQLELGYTVDHKAREIRLAWLAREGRPHPIARSEPPLGDSPYKIELTPSARTLRDALPPEKLAAVDAIMTKLAEDPDKYSYLATPTDDGRLEMRQSSASVQVTYTVAQSPPTLNVEHVTSLIPARQTLFVSHCSKDMDAYAKVMTFLRRLPSATLIDVWSDELIDPGDTWNDKILEAIDRCQAALLLVSPDFLDSTFINEHELPRLFERRKQKLTRIFWVPIKNSTVRWSHQEIFALQALIDPKTTLQEMEEKSPSRYTDALVEITDELRKALLTQVGQN